MQHSLHQFASFRTAFDRLLPPGIRSIKANAGRIWRYVRGRFASVNEAPVFVLGNQKSGTTVIAAALAHAMDRSVTLDVRDISAKYMLGLQSGGLSLEQFVSRYRIAFSRGVIKEPGLTFVSQRLFERFPNASYVLIARDPRDNIRSLLNRLGLPGSAGRLTSEPVKSLHPIWQSVLQNRVLGVDAAHYIEQLASRWNLAVDVYLENPERVQLLKYESFCDKKTEYIKTAVRQLGFDVVQNVSDVVEQQYQSRGNRAVDWEEFFGRENLTRIEQQCGSRMEKLGYPRSRNSSRASNR